MRATIKAKLAGAFAFLLLITGIIGVFGITNMSTICRFPLRFDPGGW